MNEYRENLEKLIKNNLKIYTKWVGKNKMYYIPDTDEWVYRFNKSVINRTGYNQTGTINTY